MAKMVVTSTTNTIVVVFNDYASTLNLSKGAWSKSHIKTMSIDNTSGLVYINIDEEPLWTVSYNGATGSFQIDTVDGATPTSNTDLYSKLIALIA